jgi:hypothetical protein
LHYPADEFVNLLWSRIALSVQLFLIALPQVSLMIAPWSSFPGHFDSPRIPSKSIAENMRRVFGITHIAVSG